MKRILRLAVLVCAMVLLVGGVVRANNHQDSSFKFKMVGSSHTDAGLWSPDFI